MMRAVLLCQGEHLNHKLLQPCGAGQDWLSPAQGETAEYAGPTFPMPWQGQEAKAGSLWCTLDANGSESEAGCCHIWTEHQNKNFMTACSEVCDTNKRVSPSGHDPVKQESSLDHL